MVVAVAGVAAPVCALAEEVGRYDIAVLSYNVHGLFRLAAKDNPRNRMPTIGWLANNYDVVLLQEDFEFPDIIRQQMQRAVGRRGNGLAGHPGLLAAKILAFPFTFAIPRFSPPYGSGLTSYLPSGMDVPDAMPSRATPTTTAWVVRLTRGLLGAQGILEQAGCERPQRRRGGLHNTHIEAGYGSRSRHSRRAQFRIAGTWCREIFCGQSSRDRG
jgi:hypothetical protein